MGTVRNGMGTGTGGQWLAAACAVSLWLAPHAAIAQQQQTPPTTTPGATTPGTPVPDTGTTTALDFQALNRSLQVERTLAQFFIANAAKAYLTAAPVVNPGTGTEPTPGTDPGTTTPPVTSGSALSATLTGAEETPPVTTSATGTAPFNFNEDRTQLAYNVSVSGLSGPATGMHIQRGAPGVAGPIVYPLTTPDANGVSTGTTAINAEDVDGLMQGAFYLNVHTAANPAGEIRGQVLVAAQPTPTPTPGTTPGATPVGLDALRGMVTEMRTGHTAHVTLLEQALGTNAQPVPTFQNLDAPTLQQFLTMAVTLEDFAVSAHQGVLQAWLTSGAGLSDTATATQPGSPQSLLSSIIAVALADARYAGALRAYRRGASTADGGDPNTTITEDGGAQNVPRDAAQVDQFLQQYIVTTGTQPVPQPGTTIPPANGTPTPTPTPAPTPTPTPTPTPPPDGGPY